MDTPIEHLTRDQLDAILEGMTARDIFGAIPTGRNPGEAVAGGEIAGDTFDKAAERQGYGPAALDRVRPGDAVYLAQKLGEVFGSESPKDGSTGPLPDSSGIGESPPSS